MRRIYYESLVVKGVRDEQLKVTLQASNQKECGNSSTFQKQVKIETFWAPLFTSN